MDMLSVNEAFEAVIAGIPVSPVLSVPIEKAAGMVLAEDVLCDIDMPPFDRSAMDGYALPGPSDRCTILEEIPAGSWPPALRAGSAAPIMTGAPVPPGADRVVKVEDTRVEDGKLLVLAMPDAGENICKKAEDISAGAKVLEVGTVLAPSDTGIAAMAGRTALAVHARPVVSILTTGTEVIPPVCVPGPGQVRNANSVLLVSLLGGNGFPAASALHCGDDPASLKSAISQAMSLSSVLLTAGGISMGTRDYIPQVLEELGFRFHFRAVAQKPGKPFSFATGPLGTVFGLPGNPVSVLTCFELYVLPALRYASGALRFRPMVQKGALKHSLRKRHGRQDFFRAVAENENGKWSLGIPPTSGSGDLMSTRGVNCIAWLPPDCIGAECGEDIPFILMSHYGGGFFLS
jgi:molybdopterin molybdotransferase